MFFSSSEKQLYFSRFFFGFLRHEKKCSFRALKSNFFLRFFERRKKMLVSSSEKQVFCFEIFFRFFENFFRFFKTRKKMFVSSSETPLFFLGFLRGEKKCWFRALKSNFYFRDF